MKISIDIQDSTGDIVKKILREIQRRTNSAIKARIPRIQRRIGDLTKELIIHTPEFDSLLHGKLKNEFGLKDPQYALISILDKLSENVKISFSPLKIIHEELVGELSIEMVQAGYGDILGLPESKYQSGSNRIDWLEWLILKGDSIIIADYTIRYFQKPIDKSRTNNALMFKNKKGKSYRVPSEFSGTEENNFITRAFTENPDTERLIAEICEEEILASLI